VIGIPDELRGEAIKGFVVATSPSPELAVELKVLVRERLAAYEVPARSSSSSSSRSRHPGRAGETSCGVSIARATDTHQMTRQSNLITWT
jgi:hypothetical protein